MALLIDDRESKGSDTQEALAVTAIGDTVKITSYLLVSRFERVLEWRIES